MSLTREVEIRLLVRLARAGRRATIGGRLGVDLDVLRRAEHRRRRQHANADVRRPPRSSIESSC